MRLATLSHQWRHGSGTFFAQRHAVIGLSLATMSSLGLITLYQVGIIRQLPEPRLPWFDAEKVTGSDEAYTMFSTPDAVLGLASYAVTTGLATKGDQDRARTHPAHPRCMDQARRALLLVPARWWGNVRHRAARHPRGARCPPAVGPAVILAR